MIARILIAAAVATVAFGRKTTWRDLEKDLTYGFDDYCKEFMLDFTDDERSHREGIFLKNLKKIRSHNKRTDSSYKMGVNQFAHLTPKEFKVTFMRGYDKAAQWSLGSDSVTADLSSHKNVQDLPASLDWRTVKPAVVTPPKNQGGCGSCWAFSTAETVESHIAIKTGKLLTLSPQELVDCSPNPNDCGGTGGCQGSTQWLGFEYIEKNGMTSEDDYPYRGHTQQCNEADVKKAVVNITGHVRLPKNNYSALMNAVVQQPIAISAAAEPWQLYEEGVYDGECGTDVDHAIQLVGYGSDTKGLFSKKTVDYWLVRNSWGAYWGEKGYIRIERFGNTTQGSPCATDRTPLDGTGCKDGPKTIEVCGLCGILSDSSYPTGGGLV